MMHQLTRYVVSRFLWSYIVCFISLLTLYIVIDAFTKIDEFLTPVRAGVLNESGGAEAVASGKWQKSDHFLYKLAIYYGYRIPVFFERLGGIVLLMAGAFTLGWMERSNELVPILSAGISIRRIATPLALTSIGLLLISFLNSEYVIPRCASFLLRDAEDPMGRRPALVQGQFDSRGIHIEARIAFPSRQMIQGARVTLPSSICGKVVHLSCVEMFFRPGTDTETAGWWINGCDMVKVPEAPTHLLHEYGNGKYFLVTDLDFKKLTRKPQWFLFESITGLMKMLLDENGLARRDEIITLLHQRVTMPLVDFLVLLLAFPLVIGRANQSLYIRLGNCLILYMVVQGLLYASSIWARSGFVEPTLAGWLPLVVFGPLVIPWISSIRT